MCRLKYLVEAFPTVHGGNTIGLTCAVDQSYTIHANTCCRQSPSTVIKSRSTASITSIIASFATLSLRQPFCAVLSTRSTAQVQGFSNYPGYDTQGNFWQLNNEHSIDLLYPTESVKVINLGLKL